MKRIACLLVAVSLLGLSACTAAPATESPAPTSTPTEAPAPTPSPSPSDSAMLTGIPGSHIKDIQLGVANFGMDDDSADGAPDGAPYRWTASKSWDFPDTTILLDYSITGDEDSQLISGSFGVTWDGVTESDTFNTIASTYLGFIATVPYDTSNTQEAKQWVSDQIETVAGGDPVSTTIGDATFTLSGTLAAGADVPSSYLLQIDVAN